MPLCRKILILMITMPVPGAIAFAAGLIDGGGPASVNDRSALGAIFDDDHVAQEALQIHERAMRLDDSARFDFLARWVLPSEDHRTLRMECEFTQTCPAPMFQQSPDVPKGQPGAQPSPEFSDRKSTRLNSSHVVTSRMPSSA